MLSERNLYKVAGIYVSYTNLRWFSMALFMVCTV